MITWKRYLARRRLELKQVVSAHGLSYEKLVTYFEARGVVPPSRDDLYVVSIFGKPMPASEPKASPEIRQEDLEKPKKQKKVQVSIKDTKKTMLGLASRLGLDSVNDRMTKANILKELEKSKKVNVVDVKTNSKKGKK